MPGASGNTKPVTILNANWAAGTDGGDGRFEFMIVTEDEQVHTIAPSPAAAATLITLAKADAVLMWDPDNRTLIAANIVGIMPWTRELAGNG